MNELIRIGAWNLAAVFAATFLLWAVSVAKRDASIIDPFWGVGFVLIAWLTVFQQGSLAGRAWLIAALTTVWGLRLALFLVWRNWGQGEDYRYRAMREKHGPRFWLVSLATVFWFQALVMWLVSWPIQFGQQPDASSLGWLDFAGGIVWTMGFLFETVGDFQLSRFKADPANRGRVMDRGLWRYTRHPNYFGDFCVWWGLYCIAMAGGAWWTVHGPLLMSFFLLKLSGVALLEKTIAERRPGYREYVARTNAFFPGLPRNE